MARSILVRPDAGSGAGGRLDRGRVVPRPGRFPDGNHSLGLVPVGFPGLLTAELAAKDPGYELGKRTFSSRAAPPQTRRNGSLPRGRLRIRGDAADIG